MVYLLVGEGWPVWVAMLDGVLEATADDLLELVATTISFCYGLGAVYRRCGCIPAIARALLFSTPGGHASRTIARIIASDPEARAIATGALANAVLDTWVLTMPSTG